MDKAGKKKDLIRIISHSIARKGMIITGYSTFVNVQNFRPTEYRLKSTQITLKRIFSNSTRT